MARGRVQVHMGRAPMMRLWKSIMAMPVATLIVALVAIVKAAPMRTLTSPGQLGQPLEDLRHFDNNDGVEHGSAITHTPSHNTPVSRGTSIGDHNKKGAKLTRPPKRNANELSQPDNSKRIRTSSHLPTGTTRVPTAAEVYAILCAGHAGSKLPPTGIALGFCPQLSIASNGPTSRVPASCTMLPIGAAAHHSTNSPFTLPTLTQVPQSILMNSDTQHVDDDDGLAILPPTIADNFHTLFMGAHTEQYHHVSSGYKIILQLAQESTTTSYGNLRKLVQLISGPHRLPLTIVDGNRLFFKLSNAPLFGPSQAIAALQSRFGARIHATTLDLARVDALRAERSLVMFAKLDAELASPTFDKVFMRNLCASPIIDEQEAETGDTVFLRAVKAARYDIAARLLKCGSDALIDDWNGNSAKDAIYKASLSLELARMARISMHSPNPALKSTANSHRIPAKALPVGELPMQTE